MPQPSAHSSFGFPFVELQSVDSTNNYARNLIYEGLAQHGMAIFAHEQLAGKGQRGKIWSSDKDVNIILSLIINPKSLMLTQQFQLSVCIAVAVHEIFMQYAGDLAKIKWPNDLYWQDRKAGGILIESVVNSGEIIPGAISHLPKWQWAIVGIGININQTAFPSYLKNPVSLRQITGKSFNTVILAKEICGILNTKFDELMEVGYESIYAQYLTHLYKINSKVKLRKDTRVFEAVIKGVTPDGKLIVFHSFEEEFNFGDVEWVI
ncbi:MAG: biotin--[acetyl-CoA-carboxylase] ligase [Chitinophagaceae bacterium]